MATSKENVDNYKFTNLEPQVITARAQLQQLLSREDLRLERNSEENSTLTLDSLAEEFDEALSSLSMDTNSAVRLLSEARAVAQDRLGLGSSNLANMEETFAELPLAKVRSSAAVFARLLEESKDEQVLRETCLGLCQLFGDGIQNDRIQAILETDVVPKLIALLQPQQKGDGVRFPVSVAVQSAALQVIGNIACGDDRQTQIIIDCNALPCLKALLSSPEKGIRKECCWIISNITESAHQVEDVIEADILPTLIELIDNNDVACREDASWVLYNITANFDEGQIQYLVDKGGINSFCNLLESTKELDVFWKCCSTISSIALKGLRNILFVGEQLARTYNKRYNPYAALVVECNGVEKIEMLAQSSNMELVRRALSIIHTFFGAESVANSVNIRKRVSSYKESIDYENSESEESVCSDLEDDIGDHDLLPPALAPCQCVLCTDFSPLLDKKSKPNSEVAAAFSQNTSQPLGACEFCDFTCSGQNVSSRVVLAGKLGRAVRMGHSHCLAAILARMKWGDRSAAIETPAGVRPGGNKSNNRSNSLPETSLPAFVLAAKLGKPLCLEMIIRKCKPELDATFGRKRLTALAWAAYKGYLRCCQILLDNGANPQARCADGLTALHLAASSGYARIVSLLLERGAQVDVKSAKGQTPLFHACQKGHSQVVQMLLSAGANANLQDEQQLSPLHLGAIYGQSDCVGILIHEGHAQVDLKSSTETTPLHYAVRGGHVEVVKCLLENGASLSFDTSTSHSASQGGGSLLFIAVENGDIECTRILLEFGCSVHQTVNMKLLIHKDFETSDCVQPLALAASKGHGEIVDLLIQYNADIQARTSKGWTPLDLAVLNGHTACVKRLLSHGATVDNKVKTLGKMSFTLVQFSARFGHREMLRMLVDKLKSQQESKSLDAATDNNDNNTGSDKSLCAHSETNGSEGLSCSSLSSSSSNRATGHVASSATMIAKRRPQRDIGKGGGMGGEDFFKRERKRKEVEANEVLTKLDDAMNCKSIPKLTESIAHANKLLLQIAALRPDSQQVGYSKEDKAKSGTNVVEEKATASWNQNSVPSSAIPTAEPVNNKPEQVANDSSHPHPHPFSLGRKLEYHLSKNIQKARETLSRIQEEERRWREEKLQMEKKISQEQARKQLTEALSSVEKIGDHKALTRALKRAERLGMTQDALYQEAFELNERIKKAIDVVKYLQGAQSNEQIEQVHELLQQGRSLKDQIPTLLANKIFGETSSVLENAEVWFYEKQKEKEKAMEAQRKKEAEEKVLMERAEQYIQTCADSEQLGQAEQLVKEIEQFISLHSNDVSDQLRIALDSVKKNLGKVVKAERKRLRQLCSSEDEGYIENELRNIRGLGLHVLSRDIQQVEQHLQRLRSTKAVVDHFQSAVMSNDTEMMNKWRQEMESLGMIKEAEEARVVIEQRRRQAFFKSQLETLLEETRELVEAAPDSVDRWPDGRRLSILCKKANKYEGLDQLVERGRCLAQRLGEWCRSKLLSASDCGDPKVISYAMEKFVSCLGEEQSGDDNTIAFDALFDAEKCESAWEHAQQRLKESQARIQEQVWMELSSSKLEASTSSNNNHDIKSVEETAEFHNRCSHPDASLEDESKKVEEQDSSSVASGHSKEAIERNRRNDDLSDNNKNDHHHHRPRVPPKKRISRPLQLSNSPRLGEYSSSSEENPGQSTREASENMEDSCTHFYVWLDRNQVVCNKCKHVVVVQNKEWLEWMKRRSSSSSSFQEREEDTCSSRQMMERTCGQSFPESMHSNHFGFSQELWQSSSNSPFSHTMTFHAQSTGTAFGKKQLSSSPSSSSSCSSSASSIHGQVGKPTVGGLNRHYEPEYPPSSTDLSPTSAGIIQEKSEQAVCFGTFMENVPRLSDHLNNYYTDSKQMPSVSFIYPNMADTSTNSSNPQTTNHHPRSSRLDAVGLWNHPPHSSMSTLVGNEPHDISEEFAKENFGFHIEDIVDEDNSTMGK